MAERVYLVVYASRIGPDGMPCPDARGRCDRAIALGKRYPQAWIVLTSGLPEQTKPLGFSSLSESMRAYLVKKGWPAEQIKMDPRGYNSISDTVYALGLVEGGDKVIAVTAWYHAFRVWLIWLRLGRLVGVGISWKTYPWTNPLREFLALTKTIVVLAFGQLKPRFS